MDRVIFDDCMYALGQVMEFYEKKLTTTQQRFWSEWVREQNGILLKRALKEYTGVGKYAPKPKDLKDLIDGYKEFDRSQPKIEHKSATTSCPKEISDAWRYWLPEFHGTAIGGMMGRVNGVSAERAEEMLYVVNREARRTNLPDAIPAEYKIAEVWA